MFIVALLAVMVIHCYIWIERIVSCEELSREGDKVFLNIHISMIVQLFYSKISCIMFLHHYLLVAEFKIDQ